MFKTILIIFSLTFMLSGCRNNEKPSASDAPIQPVIQSQSGSSPSKKSLTSKECNEKEGGVFTNGPEKQGCPNGKEYLGEVNDLDCFCSCCK